MPIFLSSIKLWFALYTNFFLRFFVLFLEALLVVLNLFISSSFLSLIFSSYLNNPSFLSSWLNPLLNILPNGEYSNFARSTVLGLRPKSSPVNNSYLSKLFQDNADILAASLSKSYCDSFCLIFLIKILIWSVTVIFYKVPDKFFLKLKGLLDGNVYLLSKKNMVLLCILCKFS